MIHQLSSTQSLLASPISSATTDIRWMVSLLPRHESFVELTGGDHPLLLAKARSQVEVFNDRRGLVVNLYRLIRDPRSAKQLADVVSGTVPVMGVSDELKSAARFFRGSRAAILASQTQSWKYGVRFHQCFDGTTEIFEPMIRRFCGAQIEKLAWEDAVHRYDSPRAVFSVNLDAWAGGSNDRLRFSDSKEYRDTLFRQLASIRGKAFVYSRLLSDLDLPHGWHRHRRQSNAVTAPTPLIAWTNYTVSSQGGTK